jgi:hypothetical protein
MDREHIKRIIDSPDEYDEARGDSIASMLSDFYNRKMLSIAILVWAWALVFIAGAVGSAIMFFASDQTRDQIMYSALFVCLVLFVGFMKVFAWLMIARNGIKREVKRLELRIAELAQALAEGPNRQ